MNFDPSLPSPTEGVSSMLPDRGILMRETKQNDDITVLAALAVNLAAHGRDEKRMYAVLEEVAIYLYEKRYKLKQKITPEDYESVSKHLNFEGLEKALQKVKTEVLETLIENTGFLPKRGEK